MDDTTPMAESEEELNLLMRVNDQSGKARLKLNIKRKIILGFLQEKMSARPSIAPSFHS